MRDFWTRGWTRVLALGAAIVACLAVGASIGGAAIGGLATAAPGKLASGAQSIFAGSSSSAQEQQYPKGKTTICHHTGSQSNPFVMITVSNRALPAHARHGDIIPAPAGGCPTATPSAGQAAAAATAQPALKLKKVKKAKARIAHKAKKAKKANQRAQSRLNAPSAENASKPATDKKAKKSKPQHVARHGQIMQKTNRGSNANGNRGGKK
jgi:hypothetical protein